MKQPSIDQSAIVDLDYNASNIPSTVTEFKPVVFHDGDAYCCMLGSNPQEGVFGCGCSPQEAMEDWAKHFDERLEKPYENDQLIKDIQEFRSGETGS